MVSITDTEISMMNEDDFIHKQVLRNRALVDELDATGKKVTYGDRRAFITERYYSNISAEEFMNLPKEIRWKRITRIWE